MHYHSFKKILDRYKDMDKNSVISYIHDALTYANIAYTTNGDYEIVIESDTFLNNVNEYIKRLDDLIEPDAQGIFITYSYTPDYVFIRLRFK